MKTVYFYNKDTKEFSHKGLAQLDPLESKLQNKKIYLCPASATFIETLPEKYGFSQIWSSNGWQYIEDNRGKEYWNYGDSFYDKPHIMKELGHLPNGASLIRPKKTEEELSKEKIINAKIERANYVSKLIVEVDGLKFDGDETSQDRMARSIVALNDGETIQWILADNTIVNVTKEQLRQALRLSGEAQTAIWTNPYL